MTTGDATSSEPSGHRPPGQDGAAATPGGAPRWQPPGGDQSYPPPGQGYTAPGHPPPDQGYPPPGQGYPPPGQGYPPPGNRAPGAAYPPPGYQQAPPPGGYQVPSGSAISQQDERTWILAAHLSSLVGMIFGLSFVGPLVVMLVQGPKSPAVRAHAVESLNFNLSILIYFIASVILSFIVIGIFTMIAVGIVWLVFTIIAAVKAGSGEFYRYPLTIRMVS